MSLPPPPKQLEEFQNLIEEVHLKSAEAKAIIDSLNKKVGNADFETKEGLSFLELKNHVMLDYMANLTYVMLRKCSGKSINGEKAIERICEDRTVLEKMKPTEKKLRYQIDKALKIAESGQMSSNDPLNFRPNLSALKNEGSGDDDEADSDEESGDEGTIFENLDLFPLILNFNICCMKWQHFKIGLSMREFL
jgi:U3 small nucleolar ribonucleoprotein protein LCP5